MKIIYNLIKNIAIFISIKWYQVNYYNIDNIPKDRGCLICCNHRSNWDSILIAKPINKKLFFMAKQELFKISFFGWILKKLGAYPIKRGDKDLSAINHTINLLNNNNLVVMFPEGTRSRTSEFLKPKAGAAMVAYKTNADILPVRIIYHEPIKFRSRIDVIYGKIIHPDQLNITNNSLKEIKAASFLIMDHIKSLNIKE